MLSMSSLNTNSHIPIILSFNPQKKKTHQKKKELLLPLAPEKFSHCTFLLNKLHSNTLKILFYRYVNNKIFLFVFWLKSLGRNRTVDVPNWLSSSPIPSPNIAWLIVPS